MGNWNNKNENTAEHCEWAQYFLCLFKKKLSYVSFIHLYIIPNFQVFHN
jgi:hypothetical protein